MIPCRNCRMETTEKSRRTDAGSSDYEATVWGLSRFVHEHGRQLEARQKPAAAAACVETYGIFARPEIGWIFRRIRGQFLG